MGIRTTIARALVSSEMRREAHVRDRVGGYVREAATALFERWSRGLSISGGDVYGSSDNPYATHSTVRACFDIRAEALAAMPFRLWGGTNGKRDKQFVPEHPIYDLITPQMVRQLQLFWDASGNVWVRPEYDGLVAKSQGGVKKSGARRMPDRITPYGLVSVRPRRASITSRLTGWDFRDDEGDGWSHWRPVDVAELIHIRYGTDPFSLDRLLGISKLCSLNYELASEAAQRGWNIRIFRRGGLPSFVAAWKPKDPNEDAWLDPERRKAAEAAFNEYLTNNGGAMVMPGDFDLLKLGVSPREMEFAALAGSNRDRIASTYHVDPVLVGNVDTAGLSEARIKTARIVLYELAILSNATTVERALQPLVRAIAPGLIGQFAREEVPVLRADEERTIRIAKEAFGMGVPLNNIIDAHDLPYDKVPWGDEWWIGYSQTTAADAQHAIDNPEPRLIGEGPGVAPSAGGPEDDNDDAGDEGDEPAASKVEKQEQQKGRGGLALVPRVTSARALVDDRAKALQAAVQAEIDAAKAERAGRRRRRHQAILATFAPLERRLQTRVVSHLTELAHEVVGNLQAVMQRSPADQVRRILFDKDRADAKLRALFRPYLEEAITIGADGAAAELGTQTIGIEDATTRTYLEGKQILVKGINATIREDLRRTLMTGIGHGENITDLQSRVLQTVHGVGNARALRIARTETASAVNGGRFLQMRHDGVDRIEWLSARDEHVRKSHHELDGVVRHLGLPFLTKDEGGPLYFPGDPLAPPAQIVNCRCSLVAAV